MHSSVFDKNFPSRPGRGGWTLDHPVHLSSRPEPSLFCWWVNQGRGMGVPGILTLGIFPGKKIPGYLIGQFRRKKENWNWKNRGKSYTAHPSVVSYATFNPFLRGVKATVITWHALLVPQLLFAQKPNVWHTRKKTNAINWKLNQSKIPT